MMDGEVRLHCWIREDVRKWGVNIADDVQQVAFRAEDLYDG